nr:MAG TPA: endonuclease-like protein [Caudoviricetes sp.]
MKTLFTTEQDLSFREKYLKLFMRKDGKMKPGVSEEEFQRLHSDVYNWYMNIPVPHQKPASKFLIIKANDSSLGYCKHCGEFIESNGASKGFPETHKKTCSTAYRHRELTKEREERRCDYCGELIGNHKGMRHSQRYHNDCYKKYVKHTLRYTSKGVDWSINDMVEDYRKGMSPQEIRDSGKYINPETGRSLSNSIIREKIREAIGDEEMRSYEEGRVLSDQKQAEFFCNIISEENKSSIERDFQEGMTISEIANKYKIRTIAIYNLVGEITPRSKVEIEFEEWFKELGYKVETNTRNEILIELDLFLPEKRLAIEFNGLWFHSEKYRASNYHSNKFNSCNRRNINLLQFTDRESGKRKEVVKDIISKELFINQLEIKKEDCIVDIILFEEAKMFVQRNSLSEDYDFSSSFGLRDNEGNLVKLITLKKNKTNWEIKHIVTKLGVIVDGGLNLLMKSIPNNKNIIYQDNHFYSLSKELERNSFREIKRIPISFQWTNGIVIKSNKDTSLEEKNSKKWYKFYDAGKTLYEWKTN